MDSDADDDGFMKQIQQRVGRTLCNKYSLESVLGVGGMASVYRGRHRNGNRVAVKMLHTELSVSKEIRERFLREGYVANRVDHHGAVRVLDDDIAEDGAPFLVMELLEGETLEEHIVGNGGALSPRQIVPIARELLEVLVAAHERGIVHRDIKPENLFITKRDGSVKVLDFGIARLSEGAKQVTRTGRVMGTPVYMAPEQARGETKLVDGQTDVWAAAASTYRALTGHFVHEAETAEMVLVRAATQPARPLRDVHPGVDPRLAEIVDRGLAWDKAQRWPNARAMLTALEGLRPEELSDVRSSRPSLPRTVDMTQPLERGRGVRVDDAGAREATQLARAISPPGLPTFDEETELAAPIAAAFIRAYGPSTTAGLARADARSPAAPRSPSMPRRSVGTVLALVGTGALLVVGGLSAGLSVRSSSSVDASTTGAEVTVAAVATHPVEPTAAAAPTATDAATQASPPPVDAASARIAASPVVPPARVLTTPPGARPASTAVAPSPPAIAPPAIAPPARSVATPAPVSTCDPPWALDAHGVKVFKTECFKK